jgi:nucleoside 2-deoxyribosyltransferase
LKELDIETYSPMRGKEYLMDETEFKQTGYAETLLSSDRSIVARDRFDVQSCDLVFMNLFGAERISIGSMVELGWADAYRKPVVTMMGENSPYQHAFVKELSGWVVKDYPNAIRVIKAVLLTT